MFANGARQVAPHGEEWIVLHDGSGGGAANVCRVAALALEFGHQADPAKRQQRKQPEDTHNDGKPPQGQPGVRHGLGSRHFAGREPDSVAVDHRDQLATVAQRQESPEPARTIPHRAALHHPHLETRRHEFGPQEIQIAGQIDAGHAQPVLQLSLLGGGGQFIVLRDQVIAQIGKGFGPGHDWFIG